MIPTNIARKRDPHAVALHAPVDAAANVPAPLVEGPRHPRLDAANVSAAAATDAPPSDTPPRKSTNDEEVEMAAAPTDEYRAFLAGRLDHVRKLGRSRQLRIQIPLAIAGTLSAAAGVGAGLYTGWFAISGYGMVIGPFLLLLCVSPTQTLAIGCSATAAILIAAVAVLLASDGFAHPCRPIPPPLLSCEAFHATNVYVMVVLSFWIAYACSLVLGLVGYARKVRWLPSRPPRATLDRLWRCGGGCLLSYAPAFFAFAAGGSYGAYEEQLDYHTRAGVQIGLGALRVALGVLALWPGLRVRVQARLAALGEGVAAAGGISELLGFYPTQQLILVAEATFRSVRLDLLQPRHLSRDACTHEAFSLSVPSRLTGVDAFITHSWRDTELEKWALLQLWRADFVRQYGREPKVWLDRCCLHPSDTQTLLPCLPVYLAGCDKLVALRGPTFLSRLWCCVELYVFYEMKANSRIEILDFDSVPPYDEDGEQRSSSTSPNAPTPPQRFDVRRAKCSVPADEERMLAVIEGCGAGFESFNAWMHDMLRATPRVQSQPLGGRGRSPSGRHWIGKLIADRVGGATLGARVRPITSAEEEDIELDVQLNVRASLENVGA